MRNHVQGQPKGKRRGRRTMNLLFDWFLQRRDGEDTRREVCEVDPDVAKPAEDWFDSHAESPRTSRWILAFENRWQATRSTASK